MRKVNSHSRANYSTQSKHYHHERPTPKKHIKLNAIQCINAALSSGIEIKLIRNNEHIASWTK